VIERSPTGLVFALVRVVNGEAPRLSARDILDPMVEIRMDAAPHCGIKKALSLQSASRR
jgi:hypothetical protein